MYKNVTEVSELRYSLSLSEISEQDSVISEPGDFLGGTDSRSISRVLHIEALNRRQRRVLIHSALGVEPVPHEMRF